MPPRVHVFGGAVRDILAGARRPLIARSSTPGAVRTSAGGVGRNIAENLARLGTSVSLVAAFGDDADGADLRALCADAGIDLSCAVTSGYPTGRYVAVLDEGGELAHAVNDLRATEAITPADCEPALARLDAGDIVVVDTNLLPATLAGIAAAVAAAGAKLVAEPVSVAKAPRLLALDPAPWLITPNRDELVALAAHVAGPGTHDAPRDLAGYAATWLKRAGGEFVWCRLGPGGSLLVTAAVADAARRVSELRAPQVDRVLDVTGAGDAATAAFIHAWTAGATPAQAAAFGHRAAAATVASTATVRADLANALHEQQGPGCRWCSSECRHEDPEAGESSPHRLL